jgi:hypothetical protein
MRKQSIESILYTLCMLLIHFFLRQVALFKNENFENEFIDN